MKDAIIVLGRGIKKDGTLPPDPCSRVKKAAELYEQGAAGYIIMSGGYSFHLDEPPAMSEAEAMKKYAVSLGVPSDSIIEESQSSHTIANAYFVKKYICEPRKWTKLILIASDEHMPRAAYIFRKMFGADYEIDHVVSDRVLDDSEYNEALVHERASMARSKKYLEPVAPGDDQKIRELVLSLNPSDVMAKF